MSTNYRGRHLSAAAIVDSIILEGRERRAKARVAKVRDVTEYFILVCLGLITSYCLIILYIYLYYFLSR